MTTEPNPFAALLGSVQAQLHDEDPAPAPTSATVMVVVHAGPDSRSRADAIADLVTAEYGQDTRLAVEVASGTAKDGIRVHLAHDPTEVDTNAPVANESGVGVGTTPAPDTGSPELSARSSGEPGGGLNAAPAGAALRDRIADVFRTKNGQLPAWTQRDAGPDAHVDAVMAVVQPELDRYEAEARWLRQTAQTNIERLCEVAIDLRPELARADTAEATITRVRELHHPASYPDPNGPGEITYCVGCEEGDGGHPCPTITALIPPADQPSEEQHRA